MRSVKVASAIFFLLGLASLLSACRYAGSPLDDVHSHNIRETGIKPMFPEGMTCSPMTSLYGSLIDIDGLPRRTPHSGIDGGNFGDLILAPASGVVQATWQANWGWGKEGALLIRHTASDLNIKGSSPYYYSAFYHLKFGKQDWFRPGERIKRGQVIGVVDRPGGKEFYLPEVHWEVWRVNNPSYIRWRRNLYGFAYWVNRSATLVDPLSLMSPVVDGESVMITPYSKARKAEDYEGFSYIFPCT